MSMTPVLLSTSQWESLAASFIEGCSFARAQEYPKAHLLAFHEHIMACEGSLCCHDGVWALKPHLASGHSLGLTETGELVTDLQAWTPLHETQLAPHRGLVREKFKEFFHHAGRGLRFVAHKTLSPEEQEELVEFLWEFSCHPSVGRAILRDLDTYGERCTTVMPGILNHFQALAEGVHERGVKLLRAPAWPGRGHAPESREDVPPPRRYR